MTQNKKFKRTIRDRMAITGESYSTARIVILSELDMKQQDNTETKTMDDPNEHTVLETYVEEPVLVPNLLKLEKLDDRPAED